MTVDQWQRVQELFDQALTYPPDERNTFLADACADDVELRTEVKSLLVQDEQAPPDFMRPPEPGPEVKRFCDLDGYSPQIGQRIGQYRIEKVIAAGGMGTVYLAQQEHPRRAVALKVMKAGIASRSALRRFEYESQILARLRHPNIAQVYEAGTHGDRTHPERGVPYFAMEYVPEARTITEYAEQKKLGMRDRLELFAQVCEAVHHGHQKGVIHRDLKPANILVDSSGLVKIIDFGVARSTDSDVALTTLHTDAGQLVGTLQYMSPEQCVGDPHELDTRSDVYALGVVLYELLCGQLPYHVTHTTVFEAARTIREESPTRPSTINRTLRGDLETIVLKALEKDRDRRYQSASELAEDIRRYINNKPILAQPPSLAYLASKFITRHKWQTAALAAASVSLVALLIVVFVWGYAVEARRARRVAEVYAYGAKMGAVEAAIQMRDAASARKILQLTNNKPCGWEWRHLNSRVDQSIRTLVDTENPVSDFAVHPSNRLLAVSSSAPEEIVRLCNMSTGDVVRELPGHVRGSNTVAFNHDGSFVATVSRVTQTKNDQRALIKLWRVDSPDDEGPIAEWTAHENGASTLAFHPSQLILASGSGDKTIKLWDFRDLDKYRTPQNPTEFESKVILRGHENAVRCVTFSPDGSLIASSSEDYTVRLWDVAAALTGTGDAELAVLRGHTYYVYSIAFSPDGRRLASGSIDKTIRLWDVKASLEQAEEDRRNNEYGESVGIVIDVLRGHQEGVMSVAFDPSGTRVISSAGDKTIRVWDVNENATASDYRRERNWPTAPRHEIGVMHGHESDVRRVTVLPNERIVSGSADGTVKLWLPDVQDVPKLPGHITSVNAVTFTPDGQFVVSASAGNDDSFIVWDAARCVPVAKRFVRFQEGIGSIACWTDGDHTLLAAATAKCRLQPINGRIVLWNIDDPANPNRVCAFQPGDCGTCAFKSIAVSCNGKRLAVGDFDGIVRVWDIGELPNVKQIARLKEHDEEINDLLFLDEGGRWLTSASGAMDQPQSRDHTIRIWSLESRREVARYTQHTNAVTALALSPSRETLASASIDHTVRLWAVDWNGGAPRLQPKGILEGHTDSVIAVAFHPAGRRLFSGSYDQTIKIWDLDTNVEVATLRGQAGPVNDLAFDPNGVRLASASGGFQGSDNVVRLWEALRLPDPERERFLRERAVLMRAHDGVRRAIYSAVPSLDDARNRIRSNSCLPEDVREAALARFEDFLPHPWWVNRHAGNALQKPNPVRDDYLRAFEWAHTASKMAPENALFLSTLGITQYRLKRYDQALDTLHKSTKLSNGVLPSNIAFIAMAHHRLGHAGEARVSLDHLYAIMGEPQYATDEEAHNLLREAESLIMGAATSDAQSHPDRHAIPLDPR